MPENHRELTTPEVADQLRALGVERGGVLLVHTSFRAVRPVQEGPAGLIQALRDALGPVGTLVMPSWTGDDEAPFDPRTTPASADLGVVADTFWRMPGVVRSDHLFAFAAAGPHAARITADPLPLPPHVPHSPVGRVHELDGQVLLLGVNHDADTTLHLAELMADVPYRVPKHCTVLRGGRPVRIHYGENDHCCGRFTLADGWLRERGLQREGPVGHATARLARSRDITAAALEQLARDPLVFLHPPDAGCADCDEARSSITALSSSEIGIALHPRGPSPGPSPLVPRGEGRIRGRGAEIALRPQAPPSPALPPPRAWGKGEVDRGRGLGSRHLSPMGFMGERPGEGGRPPLAPHSPRRSPHTVPANIRRTGAGRIRRRTIHPAAGPTPVADHPAQEPRMDYPLQLSFKLMALTPQIYVRDAAGRVRMYVKQKMFKLRENVTVFADEAQGQPLYHIKADRVIDFNARYSFTTADGREFGAVRRRGARSLLRAHYEVVQGDDVVLLIREANPWAKVGDALLGEIPGIGLFAGYLFHPVYTVTRSDGTEVLRATKQPALWEGRYAVHKTAELSVEAEALGVLSLLMMLLLERRRG